MGLESSQQKTGCFTKFVLPFLDCTTLNVEIFACRNFCHFEIFGYLKGVEIKDAEKFDV